MAALIPPRAIRTAPADEQSSHVTCHAQNRRVTCPATHRSVSCFALPVSAAVLAISKFRPRDSSPGVAGDVDETPERVDPVPSEREGALREALEGLWENSSGSAVRRIQLEARRAKSHAQKSAPQDQSPAADWVKNEPAPPSATEARRTPAQASARRKRIQVKPVLATRGTP